MADPEVPLDEPTEFSGIGQLLTNGFIKAIGESNIPKAALSQFMQQKGAEFAFAWHLFLDAITFVAVKYEEAEQAVAPIAGRAVAPILSGLFGGNGNAGDFTKRMARGGGDDVAKSIVEGLMRAIAGNTAGPIQPGIEGATRIASAAVAAAIESHINALIPELVSDFLPFELGHITALTELPEGVLRALGIGRLVRRALSPVIDATCATPAKWHYGKLYRQTLLGHADVARQLARGHWSREQALEELARAGYSDDRIDALLNSVAKFRSVSDVFRLVRAAAWSDSAATQHLKDQGYDDDGAATELLLEKLKAIEAFDRAMASAGVDGFVAGRLSEGELGGFLDGVTLSPQEKAQHVELANARRIAGRRPLSPAEAAAAVEAGILSFVDYREALVRDGRTDDAVTVLELQLRAKVDKQTSIEDHRKQLEKDKKDAKKAADAAALVKKTAADAKLALARRGAIGALEQAAIRGLIPIGRVQEVYDATYDPDAVAALVALVESKRADYAAQQDAAAAAKVRALTRGVDVGQLERAVLTGVLTLDQFRQRLVDEHFTPDDAALLSDTIAAKLDERDQAEAAHAAAAAAAKIKHIDLKGFELLVRRGHRTVADYDALLASLGYDDGSRAALTERLSLLIDDDAAAAQVRADAAAKLRAKGLSLEQFRRAVVLGLRPIADFGPFLLQNGFTADAVATLGAELQADVDAAADARTRRAEADRRSQANRIPLADVRRAARLGRIPVSAYSARLAADHVPQGDIDLEVDLLTQEIADIQEARELRAAADAIARNKDIDLPHLEKAVRAGLETVARYTAAARAAGYSESAAATLGALLQQEIDAAAAATARRAAIAAAAAVKHVSIAQLEAAVLSGVSTIDDYTAAVGALGFADDDVALLTGIVADRLARQAAARAKQAALDAANATKALSRADFATLVTSGIRTPEAYATFLAGDGYADDDVAALVDLVKMARAKTVSADARRAELAAANPTRELARADFVKGVLADLRTVDDYAAWLADMGYDTEDAQLLVDLVLIDRQKAADKAAGGHP